MTNKTQEVKLIVAGSRSFSDYEMLIAEVKKAVAKENGEVGVCACT